MDIEFDPAKNDANTAKHGLAFKDAPQVWLDDHMLVFKHTRAVDQEDRFKALGMIGDRLHTVIYTMRGTTFRIISFRKSNDTEIKLYHSL